MSEEILYQAYQDNSLNYEELCWDFGWELNARADEVFYVFGYTFDEIIDWCEIENNFDLVREVVDYFRENYLENNYHLN